MGGLLGKLFVPTVINARATDGGLDSVVTDLPTQLGGIELYTERMAFTLQGRPAGGTGPFVRNPTSCNPATTVVEATPYGEPATTVSKSSAFTPTDCGALAFEPHITGTVGAARHDGAPGQAAGEHRDHTGRRSRRARPRRP